MPELDPGGGGINVARAIKKLGTDATAIFPSGGYTGKLFNHLLEKENIPVIIIPCQQETRENFIIREESTNNQFRFGMPGTPLSESEWKACLEAIEKMQDLDFIVASGSLPPGVPLDIYAMLARIARTKKARLVVDTSGEALQHAAEEGVYLLKPNLGELASLAGTNKIEPGKVEEFAKKIINENKCEVLVVSMGKSGAMLVTKDESHTIKAPEVERKSTVGAGDSMVAGIVYSLYHKNSIWCCLRFRSNHE